MQRVQFGAIVLLSGVLLATGAAAQEVSAFAPLDSSGVRGPAFMRTFGNVQPPHGFVRFCEMTPSECGTGNGQESRVYASPERLSELDDINRTINHAIAPATDMEVYGVKEYWTLPRTKGDCEDYALLKRHALVERGWPVNALLLTVVRDEKGEGHAVLTARTSQGDFILDNKVEDVRVWNRTDYQYVMRQSFLNPRVWVALDVRRAPMSTALSGVQDGD